MIRLLHWLFDFILRTPIIFWICVIANLIGAVWGAAVWYGPMLAASPLWAWLFIPDCPLAAFLGTIALFGMRAGRRWSFFYALTAFACIHYGIWTLAFWLRQWTGAGVIDPFEVVLFVTHIGLLCEGILFATRLGEVTVLQRVAVVGWFVLAFGVDYGLGYHPPLASHVTFDFIMWLTVALTGGLSIAMLALPRRAAQPVRLPTAA
ncbi:DUF1405 domain-containing protein [Roseiflexus castenholzii]|uniref:DUF1405 domain-containing protein n=1 Tax=Roseiflexus castenholzii TaxID=120962 RepID=UPI003C799897